MSKTGIMEMTAHITSAYLSRNQVPQTDVGTLVKSVHAALEGISTGEAEKPVGNTIPAVPIKKSVTEDYIVCLEDGKKLKMLKRYLRSHFDMSPEDYRRKWGLTADYPMVAPAYAKRRSDFAKSIGLGRTSEPGKRGRKKTAK
jgi:predicted transcriptional regulator